MHVQYDISNTLVTGVLLLWHSVGTCPVSSLYKISCVGSQSFDGFTVTVHQFFRILHFCQQSLPC